LPDESAESDFIPRLWATRRVGYLLDEIRLHGETSELRDEVTDLARKYGIVTPFTAYLIIEDETRQNVPVRMRSLQSFESDSEARREAAANWQDYKTKREGEQAVAGARYGLQLKAADAAAPAALNSAIESQRALGLPTQPGVATTMPADSGKTRLMQYSQQSQFVAGKTFFQNDKEWIDSAIQKFPNAKRVRVQFGSPEYFNLLAKNTRMSSWLALGQNVQFVLDNTVYEIYE
jgi:Ca-activated chloride channel homolog